MSKIATLIAFSVLLLPLPALADYPERQTYELVMKRYSLELRNTRGACTWYANPTSWRMLTSGKRSVSVLEVGEGKVGSGCNGIFRFLAVTAECESGYISSSEQLGSIPGWKVYRELNLQTATKICSLPYPENEWSVNSCGDFYMVKKQERPANYTWGLILTRESLHRGRWWSWLLVVFHSFGKFGSSRQVESGNCSPLWIVVILIRLLFVK